MLLLRFCTTGLTGPGPGMAPELPRVALLPPHLLIGPNRSDSEQIEADDRTA